MIYGVTFKRGNLTKHTFTDWGLFQVGPSYVSPAEPVVTLIDVPGLDGSIDFTDAIDGRTHYKTRTFTGVFRCITPRIAWKTIESEIMSFLQGRRLEMILDDDFSYKWDGRFYVSNVDYHSNYFEITITGMLDPYKTAINNGNDHYRWDPFNFELDYAVDLNNMSIDNETKQVNIYIKSQNYSSIRVYGKANSGYNLYLKSYNNENVMSAFPAGGGSLYVPKEKLHEGENTIVLMSDGPSTATIYHTDKIL